MIQDKVLAIGEILMRLTPSNYQKIKQANNFNVYFGGGEFNVVASLSNFNIKTAFLTKIANNDLGLAALQYIKSFGIDTQNIVFDNNRMGLYFSESGYSKRPTKIIYDRNDSAFSKIKIEDFDLNKTLTNISWIHISGITAAINENTFGFTKAIIKAAKTKNIKISFDINWRSALWDYNTAINNFSQLINGIDLCIGISPIKVDKNFNTNDKLQVGSNEYYLALCKQIANQYNIKHIAFTNRESYSMSQNSLRSFYFDSKQQKLYQTKSTQVDIVDRIGTGDAFSAGILYGIINNLAPQQIVEFADACFVLKHTVVGDVNILSLNDIKTYSENRNKQIRILR